MPNAGAKLPRATVRAGARDDAEYTPLHATSERDDGPMRWEASLRVKPDSKRPTPWLDQLEISVSAQRLRALLPPHTTTCFYPHGLLIAARQDRGLTVFKLSMGPDGRADLHLHWTPYLDIATGACEIPTPLSIQNAIYRAFGMVQNADSKAWNVNRAQIFAHFLDAGWNLPIPPSPGRFHIGTSPPDTPSDDTPIAPDHSDVIALRWNANPPTVLRPHNDVTFSPDIQRQFAGFAARSSPLTAPLLSRAAGNDDAAIRLRMMLTSAAVRRHDTRALQALRTAIVHNVAPGSNQPQALAALLCARASEGRATEAQDIAHRIARAVAASADAPHAEDWLFSHLRELITAGSPPDSAAPTLKNGGEDVSTPSPSHVATPTPSAPSPAPPRKEKSPHFARAYQAFMEDEDTAAWQHITRAIAAHEPIQNDAMAAMILRLVPRHHDDTTHVRAALQCVVRDMSAEKPWVRAVQLLAEQHDANGDLEAARALLTRALSRFENSVLLRVSMAQFLTRTGDDGAQNAWAAVLAHPELEEWERLQYQQELDALASSPRRTAEPAPDAGVPAGAAPQGDRTSLAALVHNAIPLLQKLCPPPSNLPTDSDEALEAIRTRLETTHGAHERAHILAQRAITLMRTGDLARAAQSWTGALILTPHDLVVLAGVAITRTAQNPARGSEGARTQYFDALDAPPEPLDASSMEHLAALRALLP